MTIGLTIFCLPARPTRVGLALDRAWAGLFIRFAGQILGQRQTFDQLKLDLDPKLVATAPDLAKILI